MHQCDSCQWTVEPSPPLLYTSLSPGRPDPLLGKFPAYARADAETCGACETGHKVLLPGCVFSHKCHCQGQPFEAVLAGMPIQCQAGASRRLHTWGVRAEQSEWKQAGGAPCFPRAMSSLSLGLCTHLEPIHATLSL